MKQIRQRLVLGLLFTLGFLSSIHAQQAAAPPTIKRASDYVNPGLPQWFRFNGEYRVRLEGVDGVGFRSSGSDAYVLGRLRLNATISPTPWLKLQLQGQDAQVAARNIKPDAPPYEDTFDLRQAYVELGNPEARTFGLRVGRQELTFGEQRLIGHLNWMNTARSFDAVRATIRNKAVRLDVFAASFVNAKEGDYNKRADGNNIHGAYAVFGTLIPKATVEPYAFWRLAPGQKTESGAAAKLDSKTVGVRLAGKLPARFDYGVEVAGQTGSIASDDVTAWAGHWVLGYAVPAKYTPRLVAEYNFASGDASPTDGRRETFDQFYPTGHDKYGLADQVGWKNVHDARSGVEFKPTARLIASAFHHSWWLANTHDGLYNAGGALVARSPAGTAGRHIGQEADFQATYTLNSLIQFGGGYAHIFPGEFLKNASGGKPYNFSYLMVTYQF